LRQCDTAFEAGRQALDAAIAKPDPSVYYPTMDDQSHEADQTPPQEWIDALARADADVAAGRLVDGAEIHRDLQAALDRMQDRAARKAKAASH
jgi:hypothetical protein